MYANRPRHELLANPLRRLFKRRLTTLLNRIQRRLRSKQARCQIYDATAIHHTLRSFVANEESSLGVSCQLLSNIPSDRSIRTSLPLGFVVQHIIHRAGFALIGSESS